MTVGPAMANEGLLFAFEKAKDLRQGAFGFIELCDQARGKLNVD